MDGEISDPTVQLVGTWPVASLYAQYLKERTHDSINEWPNGFVTYRMLNEGKSVYIIDIYVVPSERKSGVAAGMADAVIAGAKALGATEALGTVVPSAKGSTESIKVLIAYGMKIQSASQDLLVFHKEI